MYGSNGFYGGLNDEDNIYAEEFNTVSRHSRVELFLNFTYSLKRNNKGDIIYQCEQSDKNKTGKETKLGLSNIDMPKIFRASESS